MLGKLSEELMGRMGIMGATYIDRRATKNVVQEIADLYMGIGSAFRVIRRALGISDCHIGQKVADTRHIEVLFRGLFVTFAQLCLTIESEVISSVRGGEANLFTRE